MSDVREGQFGGREIPRASAMTRPRNDNIISMRKKDELARLELDWELEVVAKLNRDAEYYAQILERKPSINLVQQIWQAAGMTLS